MVAAKRSAALVLIHGVGIDRSAFWFDPWIERIAPYFRQWEAHAVTWEAIRDAENRRKGKIADLFGDVSAIWDPKVRRLCRDQLMAAELAGGDTLIVAHSLGTAIALDVLRDHEDIGKGARFLTIGSPLNWLERWGVIPIVKRPRQLYKWVNIWSPFDFFTRWSPYAIRAAHSNFVAFNLHSSTRYLDSGAFPKAMRSLGYA